MKVMPFDKAERDALLRDHAIVMKHYADARDQRDSAGCARHFAEAKALAKRYYERLPRLALGVCPVCGKPLYRQFDPFGFDGPWWSDPPAGDEPPACPHFVLLRGAVDLRGRAVRAGAVRVHPGPEVPYVIPRLAALEGMRMVIGELPMEPGYVAYPLTYFAPRRPATSELTSVWARPTYEYANASGDGGWDYANDPWDFDVQSWIDRGVVRWTEPGSSNTRLADPAAGPCPYAHLGGSQQPAEIERDRVRRVGLPDGQPNFPID